MEKNVHLKEMRGIKVALESRGARAEKLLPLSAFFPYVIYLFVTRGNLERGEEEEEEDG